MLLIKCTCGCHFTINDDTNPDHGCLQCQSCGKVFEYKPNLSQISPMMKLFADAGITIQKIPDDADFTITFNT